MKWIDRLLGGGLGLLTGYIFGTIVGFVCFDPTTDIWAALGAGMALLGLLAGMTKVYRKILPVNLLMLFGFYFGILAGILIFGNPQRDGLMEAVRSNGIYAALLGTIVGGIVGLFIRSLRLFRLLLIFAIGGFLGGYILGVALKLAPYPSFVGWSPFVIGSGTIFGLAYYFLWARTPRREGP